MTAPVQCTLTGTLRNADGSLAADGTFVRISIIGGGNVPTNDPSVTVQIQTTQTYFGDAFVNTKPIKAYTTAGVFSVALPQNARVRIEIPLMGKDIYGVVPALSTADVSAINPRDYIS